MRPILYLTLLAVTGFTGSHSYASPKFAFDSNRSILTVQYSSCLYGRGINEQLKSASFRQIHHYISTKGPEVQQQLKAQRGVNQATLNFMSQLLKVKLNKESFSHQFYLQGNDTCSHASAEMTVDRKLNFASLFDFSAPEQLHLVASAQTLYTEIKQQLRQYQITFEQTAVDAVLQRHASFSHAGEQKAYYSMDLSQYLQQVATDNNRVYVSGSKSFLPYLQQYLTDKNVQILTQAEQALWQVNVTASVEQNHYLNVQLKLHNKNTGDNLILNNDPRSLPAMDMSNPQNVAKAFKVHLALLKLSEKLALK